MVLKYKHLTACFIFWCDKLFEKILMTEADLTALIKIGVKLIIFFLRFLAKTKSKFKILIYTKITLSVTHSFNDYFDGAIFTTE